VCVWPASPQAPLLAWALIAQRAQGPAPAWLHDQTRERALPRAGYAPEPELVALLTRLAMRRKPANAAADQGTARATHSAGARERTLECERSSTWDE